MKIYDISQEVFSCKVFPGDPAPKKETLLKIAEGDKCNLTAFSMCAHNGTHVDAPYHFCQEGSTLSEVPLEKFIGMAYVAEYEGELSADDAIAILEKAREADTRSVSRILVKGNAVVTLQAAEVFAEAGILLFGNESQTVGPEDAPMQVHLTMLGAEIVLLEGIRLGEIDEGVYFLNAAPIHLGGADGAPCRAVLIEVGV
ncbi:MAG: cyclase family protein [Lachnospiraceae bacterium]|nr:cyclase family protein [Lachnospiraceae bacterium]MBQ8233929.1 cyclase family protein [Lachnospiraceae bacterium]